MLAVAIGGRLELAINYARRIRDVVCPALVGVKPLQEFAHRLLAPIVFGGAQLQIPQQAHAQAGLDRRQGLDTEFLHQCDQDREAADDHRYTIGFHADQLDTANMPVLHQARLERLHALGRQRAVA